MRRPTLLVYFRQAIRSDRWHHPCLVEINGTLLLWIPLNAWTAVRLEQAQRTRRQIDGKWSTTIIRYTRIHCSDGAHYGRGVTVWAETCPSGGLLNRLQRKLHRLRTEGLHTQCRWEYDVDLLLLLYVRGHGTAHRLTPFLFKKSFWGDYKRNRPQEVRNLRDLS